MIAGLGVLRNSSAVTVVPVVGATLQIGDGTFRQYSQLIDRSTLNGDGGYSRSSIIWTAAELGGAKTITGISLYFRSYTTSQFMLNQVIKMGMVTESIFDSAPAANLSDLTVSELTTVKSEFNFNITTNNLWYIFTFNTPFSYDGIKNLILVWDNNSGFTTSSVGGNDGSNVPNTGFIKRGNSLPITGNGTRYSNRPNIRIHY